jgi:hypothetical protein
MGKESQIDCSLKSFDSMEKNIIGDCVASQELTD